MRRLSGPASRGTLSPTSKDHSHEQPDACETAAQRGSQRRVEVGDGDGRRNSEADNPTTERSASVARCEPVQPTGHCDCNGYAHDAAEDGSYEETRLTGCGPDD